MVESFVGRSLELATCLDALAAARADRPGFLLLSGEAGIGKTHLARAVEQVARRQKLRVHIGQCVDVEGVPPLWPWVQVLRSCLGRATDASVRRWLGNGLADVVPLLPELTLRFSIQPPSVAGDADEARFRLLDSVATCLLHAAKRQAGEVAVQSRAYEEGAAQFSRARELMSAYPTACAPAVLAHTTLALADALDRSGDRPAAKPHFRATIEQARTQGDAKLLARAVLGLGGWLALTYRDEGTVAGLLQEADRALGSGDSALRASVLARLAMELAWLNSPDSMATSEQAVGMAQRVGDASAFAWAVHAHHSVVPDPRRTPELLALADATVRQAEAVGDLGLALIGHRWRIFDFLVLGDAKNAASEIGVYRALAREQRSTFHQWSASVYENLHALIEGRFAETAERGQAARAIGHRLQHLIGEGCYAAQLHIAWREQSSVSVGLADAVKSYADANPHHFSARCMAAMIYADAGELEATRREFEYFSANDFADLFNSFDWLVCSAYLAEACVRLGDVPRAQLLYDRLTAASGLMVVANPSVLYAAVDHYLGRLAATLGRHDEALTHLHAALLQYRQMGARTLITHALFEMATALRARGHAADLPQVHTLLARVVAAARALGMQPLLEQAQAALSEITEAPAVPTTPQLQPDALRRLYGLTPTEARIALLLADGHRVDSAAAQLDISIHTARTHLKRIFAKTDAHHQGDLVRLVLSTAASTRR